MPCDTQPARLRRAGRAVVGALRLHRALEDDVKQRCERARGAGLVVVALAGAAVVTLRPVGDGWSWGPPLEEIGWYLGGLGSPATLRQLLGNLVLLVPAAVAAVLAVPRLASPRVLVPLAATAGVVIELLQWTLPLGRVVSPTDAALNAAGAVLAGSLARRVASRRARSAAVPEPCPGASPALRGRLLP